MEFDFGENTTVSTLDKVPQDFRGLYIESDDGYKLDSEQEGVKSAVAAVTRLNQALKAARADAKAKASKAVDLSPLSEYGETPEQIATAFSTKFEELQNELAKGGDAKLNLEKVKQEMAQAHSKELEAKDKRSEALQNQLYTLLVENTATSAIVDAKGSPDLLMPFITNQVKVVEEDGKQKVFVVDQQKDIRYSGVTGNPMTIVELVAEMKANEKYGRLFESEQPPGGGMNPGGGSKLPTKQAAKLTATQKIAQGLNKKSA